MDRHPAKSRLVTGLLVIGGVLLLITPVCGLLFACGCNWPGKGLADRCNYFDVAAIHRCPWCSDPALGAIAALLAIAVGLGVVQSIAGHCGGRFRKPFRTAAPVTVGVLAATLTLWAWGLVTPLLVQHPPT
jgi:hypothetical protein